MYSFNANQFATNELPYESLKYFLTGAFDRLAMEYDLDGKIEFDGDLCEITTNSGYLFRQFLKVCREYGMNIRDITIEINSESAGK
jgi:hypothetical protein